MKIVKINSKFKQLADWILCHRLVVGALFAVIVAFSFVGAKRIVMKTSFDDYFVSDDPMLLKTNEFKSIFGNDYYVAVLVKNKDIFSQRSLTLIRELSNELKDSLSYADKVTSLTDIEFAVGTEEGMTIEQIVPDEIPSDAASLNVIRQKAYSKPYLAKKMVSNDGTMTWIMVKLRPFPEDSVWKKTSDIAPDMITGKEAGHIIGKAKYAELSPNAAGMPYLGYEKFVYLKSELGRLFLFAFIISIVVMLIVTRSLRGLGDPIDLAEVDAVYRPLSALLENYISATRERARRTADFLGVSEPATPFVVAVAGSVAVGKSTTARLLAHLLARFPTTPRVDLVTTDGFLLPNAVLERRGLTGRKGFPESYDRRALLEFVAAVKSGAPRVEAPVYSHTTYDVVPGARTVVERPDVLVLEGLNVLQPAPRLRPSGPWGPAPSSLAVSDFIDFSIYVDARSRDIERWYLERFLTLKHTAFTRPDSYFRRFAQIPDDIAVDAARGIWESVNLANLRENIAPTRERATLVLVKDSTHHMSRVLLRKA